MRTMAEANTGQDKELLNILCLHGYRQSAQSFREKTGAFRKIVKKYANLVFVTAPNVVPPLEPETGEKQDDTIADQRGWWFSREDNYFKAQDVTDCHKGYQESLQVVQQAFKEQGPFDGVLGFSQGASFLSLLCAIQEINPDGPIQFDFAIIVAGFRSRSTSHDELYASKITCPCLHVFGETDNVIPKEMSEDLLLDRFTEPTILQHPGGHFIPASAPQKKVYTEFLNEMLKRKKSKT